ncbi:phospholipase A2 inhibitor and Ly6/PLAUR domain-containing protein-like [Natator depressus]|uniref:phospholipase A2 inhibitor and Ly6/PLAUR domain-containing protein-like n=1 Tax=Natator depressus TaxID=27790 RepID=UPI003EB8A9B2
MVSFLLCLLPALLAMTSAQITPHGTQDTFFYKECLSSYKSDIKVPISFTVGNGQYVRINTTRCNNADNCNSGTLEVPTGSTTENGLQCPTCFALNFTVCNSSITPCTGDETYCLDFTGLLKKGSSSSPFQAKGCATASAQDIKPGTTLISVPYTFSFYWGSSFSAERIPTSGASPALGKFSFALYLPGLTGLLLVKLLS